MGCCCFSEFHDFCLGVRKKEEKCVSVAPIGAPEIRLLRLGTVTKICLPFILFPIFISISLLYMYLYQHFHICLLACQSVSICWWIVHHTAGYYLPPLPVVFFLYLSVCIFVFVYSSIVFLIFVFVCLYLSICICVLVDRPSYSWLSLTTLAYDQPCLSFYVQFSAMIFIFPFNQI